MFPIPLKKERLYFYLPLNLTSSYYQECVHFVYVSAS